MRIPLLAALLARDSIRNKGRRGAPAFVRDNADIQPIAAAPRNRGRDGGSFVLWNVVSLDLAYSVDSRRQTVDGDSPCPSSRASYRFSPAFWIKNFEVLNSTIAGQLFNIHH